MKVFALPNPAIIPVIKLEQWSAHRIAGKNYIIGQETNGKEIMKEIHSYDIGHYFPEVDDSLAAVVETVDGYLYILGQRSPRYEEYASLVYDLETLKDG